MPDSNPEKLVLELIACERCKNAFMMQKGEKIRKQETHEEIVCENCIKLEERKKKLEMGVLNEVIESQREIETSIMEVKDKIEISKPQFNRKEYLERIKKKSLYFTKSIELLQKIDESNDEKFIEEYRKLFEKMKKEND